jgi:hypothetical protein
MENEISIDNPPAFADGETPIFDIAENAKFTPFSIEAFFDTIIEDAIEAAEYFDEE